MILSMSPLFFDISISKISNVGCVMCISKLLLFSALVEASIAEGKVIALVFLHPLALVEAFSEHNLLPRTTLHHFSPRGVNKGYDDAD